MAELDEVKVTDKVNHYDLVIFLARHDPVNYPADSWHETHQELALAWPDHRPVPIP